MMTPAALNAGDRKISWSLVGVNSISLHREELHMAAGRSEMVSNDCAMGGESTIRNTMPVHIPTNYPLSRLFALPCLAI
jgi:hypothetical protein